MTRMVVMVGVLDTRGIELAFVRDRIRSQGLDALVIDIGLLGSPLIAPDSDRVEIVAAGGGDLDRLVSGRHKDEAMRVMAGGLAIVVRRLFDEGRFDEMIGMGGSGGTSIATTAMRDLPVGVPKLMVSTVGGGDVSGFAGTKDITFMPSVVDVAGFNRISRRIYANASAAIAGMVSRTSRRATTGR